MKLFVSLFLLVTSAIAQRPATAVGTWEGNATVHGQQVPIHLEITGNGSDLHAALINGPRAAQLQVPSLTGNHLLLTFNYYARTLDATLANGHLTGTFGTAATRYPVELTPLGAHAKAAGSPAQDIQGEWEIAVKSAKGESAWQLRVEPAKAPGAVKAVIQRIDGDTGSLYGSWTGKQLSNQSFHCGWAGALHA